MNKDNLKNIHCLNYNNIYLNIEDIKCFNDFNELNDMCISFYYEYMIKEKYSKLANNVILLDPSIISCIYFEQNIKEIYLMLFNLQLNLKSVIFIPVNDNTNKFKPGGGSHWALLIYVLSDNIFYYLDSTISYIKTIDNIALKLMYIIKDNIKDIDISINSSVNDDYPDKLIVNCNIERKQFNSYDCGMFVLEFTENLLKYLLLNKFSFSNTYLPDILKNIKQENIKSKRLQILSIINNLNKKLL